MLGRESQQVPIYGELSFCKFTDVRIKIVERCQFRFQVLVELENITLGVFPVEENHGLDEGPWRMVVETKNQVAHVLAVGFTKRLQHGGFDFGQGGGVVGACLQCRLVHGTSSGISGRIEEAGVGEFRSCNENAAVHGGPKGVCARTPEHAPGVAGDALGGGPSADCFEPEREIFAWVNAESG
jgi:hypothetical protein